MIGSSLCKIRSDHVTTTLIVKVDISRDGLSNYYNYKYTINKITKLKIQNFLRAIWESRVGSLQTACMFRD